MAFIGTLIPISTSVIINFILIYVGILSELKGNIVIFPITNSIMMLFFAYAVLKYDFFKLDVSIKEKLDTLRIKILYITNIIIIGLGIIVATIFIGSNYPLDTTIIETFFVTVIVIILIDLGINYTLSKYIHEKIVAPIEKISHHAEEVGKGNFNLKVGFEEEDEIAILSRQMDEMTDKLRYTSQIRENFNKALQVEVNNKTQKLQDAYDALRESDKAKKDFIDAISHEIYNPLAIISVSNEFINLDKIDRENRKYISSIQRNVLRLISLVREIEEFNLIGKDSQKLDIQKFDLKELIESISQDFILIANKRKIDLEVIPNGHDFYIEGDKENLTKVFSNLIENAVNFSNEDGRITIKIEEQDGTLKVEIKDRGIGIKHEDLENIFKKFYRAKVDDELKQGIGLGLPISLEVVNKHNGSIKVESEYGKGSKFTVILPRKHVSL